MSDSFRRLFKNSKLGIQDNFRRALLSGATLLLLGCGKVSDQIPEPQLDKKALKAAEELYCEKDQKLQEDRAALNVTFDKLTSKSHLFAFSNSNGECALREDIEHEWPSETDPLFFKMKLNRDCLPNHSIWIAQSIVSPGQHKYVFKKVADPSWPALEMLGSNKLSGSFVGGLTGLRVLACEQNRLLMDRDNH